MNRSEVLKKLKISNKVLDYYIQAGFIKEKRINGEVIFDNKEVISLLHRLYLRKFKHEND